MYDQSYEPSSQRIYFLIVYIKKEKNDTHGKQIGL